MVADQLRVSDVVVSCSTYKHFSSTTLMTGLSPFCANFGVDAAAKEPSPRNNGPSSHFASCAASRIVNGRTRTVTEMDDAPSAAAAMPLLICAM